MALVLKALSNNTKDIEDVKQSLLLVGADGGGSGDPHWYRWRAAFECLAEELPASAELILTDPVPQDPRVFGDVFGALNWWATHVVLSQLDPHRSDGQSMLLWLRPCNLSPIRLLVLQKRLLAKTHLVMGNVPGWVKQLQHVHKSDRRARRMTLDIIKKSLAGVHYALSWNTWFLGATAIMRANAHHEEQSSQEAFACPLWPQWLPQPALELILWYYVRSCVEHNTQFNQQQQQHIPTRSKKRKAPSSPSISRAAKLL
jgi:hypothetical protein